MEWSEALSIGIPEIDEQHKLLLDCINRLEEASTEEHRNLAVYFAIDRMEDYAQVHFAVEEILMRLLDYPGLGPHKGAHRVFIGEVERLKSEELTHDAHLKITAFLRDWWNHHILTLDRQYADYMLAKPWRAGPGGEAKRVAD